MGNHVKAVKNCQLTQINFSYRRFKSYWISLLLIRGRNVRFGVGNPVIVVALPAMIASRRSVVVDVDRSQAVFS